ncbi:MAG: DUF4214 domain-containing protein [Acidimicrobiales bacterium]|nr:DUF4214 domain-containing protein [Acidimicrobiales bacterium]
MTQKVLRFFGALLLASTLLMGTIPAAEAETGRDLFVSPSGSDSNTGTASSQAWRSLQFASDQLVAGDTLWVMGGNYKGFSMGPRGRSDAWIRIVNYPGANPVVDGDEGSGLEINDASYVEVRGLEFRGDADRNQNPHAIGMLITGNSHHLRFVNNVVHHFGAGGIITYHSGDHLEFYHNTIHSNANWNPDQHSGMSMLGLVDDGDGPDAYGYNNYVVGNLIYNNEVLVKTDQFGGGTRITDGNCFVIDVTLESGYQGRTLFGSNICVDNGGRGTQAYRSARLDVVNNTFYHNMRSLDVARIGSEVMAYDSHDVRFANNLIISFFFFVTVTTVIYTQIAYQNNLTVGNRTATTHSSDRHLALGTPVLINGSVNAGINTVESFTPRADSAAVDGGSASYTAALLVDFAGNSRQAGSAPDNGAVERGATAAANWPWNSDLPAPSSTGSSGQPAPTIQPTEARVQAVGRLYSAAFLRAPDARGLQYWSTVDARLVDIAYAFSISDEFKNTYGVLSNEGFVDRMYRNVLQRPADANGAAYWNNLMTNGLSRAEVLLYFSDSAEYRNQ